MKITADDLRRSYRSMSDEELLSMDQDHLTDIARQCLEEEMERRGLTHRDPNAPPAPVDDDGNAWVSAGIFQYADQARVFLPALEEAGVPFVLDEEADVLWVGSSALPAVRLLVPEGQLDEAQGIIEAHASREEILARESADHTAFPIYARVEDGIFKPDHPIDWEEGTEVEVRRRKS
jgi:hypothetical protein